MDTYQDLLGQAAKLFEEVKAAYGNPAVTPEELATADKKSADALALKERAFKLKDISTFASDVLSRIEQPKVDAAVSTPESKAKFNDWGEFLEACFNANHKMPALRKTDPRLRFFKDRDEPSEGKQMAENVGAQGGFLVPAEFQAQLQAAMAEASLVRAAGPTIIRMRRRQVDIPVLDQTATTAGIPHWFGGMRFYWTEEAAEKTHTEATFRQASLVAHKLVGYTYASDELVDDAAISLADFLGGPLGMAGGIAWMEDYTFFRGTGAGQPLGVINAGATITVARQNDVPPIQFTDLVNMLESFLPSGRGAWYVHQSCLSNLMTMQDNSGGSGLGQYIWGSAAAGVPGTLLGLPIHFTEKLPRVGSAGDVLLADWRYYLVGDRQATTVESTQYDRWKYDQTSWRAVHRVDGQPWLSTPLTLQDGTSQISPFVILGAKSS